MGYCRKILASVYHAAYRKKSMQVSSSTVTELSRCLSTLDLTFIGIGSTLGAGIYVLAGEVARNKAGPAVVLSFFIAATASLFSGLCYAELGARVPKAGSAYIYCYITIGEICGFFIGWNMILEYIIGASSIIRALSSYVDTFVNGTIKNVTISTFGEMPGGYFSSYFDVFSILITMAVIILVSLGVKNSARFNNFFVGVNITTILVVIVVGSIYAEPKNWDNFTPYGVNGVFAGAASCFFAFVGFDVIATTSEEAKTPAKSIPISISCTIAVCFLAYFGVSSVLTLMLPYNQLDSTTAIAMAFQKRGVRSLGYIVAFGAVMSMLGCTVISCMPLPRLLYAMSQDGLIPKVFSRVNEKTNVPVNSTIISGVFIALLAALLDLNQLVEMLSVGTLLAYSIVDVCVLLIRYEVRPQNQSEGETSLAIGTSESNRRRTNMLLNMSLLLIIIALLLLNIILSQFHNALGTSTLLIISIILLFFSLLGNTIFLATRKSNVDDVAFKTPLVPWVPVIALFFNIYLILSLSRQTLYRMVIWMALGTILYFGYSIHHSAENQNNTKDDIYLVAKKSPLLPSPSNDNVDILCSEKEPLIISENNKKQE